MAHSPREIKSGLSSPYKYVQKMANRFQDFEARFLILYIVREMFIKNIMLNVQEKSGYPTTICRQ